jgi:hypothetical protein
MKSILAPCGCGGLEPLRLHPRLAEVWRKKVAALGAASADPLIRDEAVDCLRGLLARVEVRHDKDGWNVEVQGGGRSFGSAGLARKKASGRSLLTG